MDLTTVGLCKSISYNMQRVAQHEADEIKRVYEKTWMIVLLWVEGLVIPRDTARARLEDLYDVVRNATPDKRMMRPS